MDTIFEINRMLQDNSFIKKNMPAVDTAGWSKVHAFFDHDDLVAKIQLEDDTYIIEVGCLTMLRRTISSNMRYGIFRS